MLGRERDAAANRKSNLAFQLKNYLNPEALKAEIVRLNQRITADTTDLATLTDGKEKRDKESDISRNTVRRNDLQDRIEAKGADDKLLKEFELAWTTAKHDEAVNLIGQVEAKKAALPT